MLGRRLIREEGREAMHVHHHHHHHLLLLLLLYRRLPSAH
jgi:hypothetical protein